MSSAECRQWATESGAMEACTNDAAIANGATPEWIEPDEGIGGPGILYTSPSDPWLWFEPAHSVNTEVIDDHDGEDDD